MLIIVYSVKKSQSWGELRDFNNLFIYGSCWWAIAIHLMAFADSQWEGKLKGKRGLFDFEGNGRALNKWSPYGV